MIFALSMQYSMHNEETPANEIYNRANYEPMKMKEMKMNQNLLRLHMGLQMNYIETMMNP